MRADIIETVILAMATEVRCVCCLESEFIMPLEGDGPLGDDFIASYTCADCEENT